MAAAGGMTPADRRKLSAIYSALDAHNNKQALKLIKAFLERHSGSPLGIALSAIAYEREGRNAEAGQALDKLIALKPRDVQVINTAAGALKVLGRHDDLTALWTNAAEAEPNNEDLQQQLFLAHGRSCNHAKQSQLASTLYKTFKKPRYLFWMAGAAYLQWHASNGKETLQLTLAEKWAAKAAEEAAAALPADALTPTVQLETVLFTLELQEALGRYEAALATLVKHAGLFKSEPALLLRSQSSLYTRLGKHKEAREAQVKILDSAADDWDAAVALVRQVQEPGKEKEEDEEMRKLFASLTERAPESRRRGPLLASILLQVSSLERLSRQSPQPALSSALLCQALRVYLAHAAGRPCVLADLSPLLSRTVAVLPADELGPLADALGTAGAAAAELAQFLPLSLDNLPPSLHPSARSLASARRFLSQYISVPVNKRCESLPLLLKAIAAASAVQTAEPSARITILLLKMYQLAGAGTLASQQVAALAPKHVQWLSLPYLFIDENVDLVIPAQTAADAYRGVAKFIADSRREMPDLATQPFRYDSFSKLREFARMREKLERSLAGPEAAIDSALFNLADTQSIGPASVLMQTVTVFAAPLAAADVAALEILSDKSVLPALSPLTTEQSALLAARHSAPEAWRRAVLVCRSTVGPFLRHLSVTPTAEQLTVYKTSAIAALAQIESASATHASLTQHPMQRGARLLVQLIDISLQLLAAKGEDADETKLSALLISLPDSVAEGLALWQATHGWWGGERLGIARRWQLEEATWASLALQSWFKMVPRKGKPARAALKKAHSLFIERLGKAIEATQWVDWRSEIMGLDAAESSVAVAVEGAQKNALAVLRNALTSMRSALQEAKP